MVKYGIGALVAVMVVGTAQAAGLSPVDIGNRHVAALTKADVDALMADYADDAVLLQEGKAVQGKAAIRALFGQMLPTRPAGATPAAAPAFKATRIWQEGDVGFLSWQMGPVNGVDEFLVRNGKIEVQVVFMGGAPQASTQ